MTAIGWLFVIVMIVAAALFLMKLIPIYIEGFNVGSVVSGMENDPEMRGVPPGKIVSTLMKRLDINMVDAVTKEDVYVTREQDQMLLEVEYEVREPLVGNLDIVVSFHKEARFPVR
jgi:hypothetical protein